MKRLAPHMYCTAEFRGELPSLFVEIAKFNSQFSTTKIFPSYQAST